jgi:hypothetical protein
VKGADFFGFKPKILAEVVRIFCAYSRMQYNLLGLLYDLPGLNKRAALGCYAKNALLSSKVPGLPPTTYPPFF